MARTFFMVACPFEFQLRAELEDAPSASCSMWALSELSLNLKEFHPADEVWLKKLISEAIWASSFRDVLKKRIWECSK